MIPMPRTRIARMVKGKFYVDEPWEGEQDGDSKHNRAVEDEAADERMVVPAATNDQDLNGNKAHGGRGRASARHCKSRRLGMERLFRHGLDWMGESWIMKRPRDSSKRKWYL